MEESGIELLSPVANLRKTPSSLCLSKTTVTDSIGDDGVVARTSSSISPAMRYRENGEDPPHFGNSQLSFFCSLSTRVPAGAVVEVGA
jgi:hypothetical protein